MKFLAFLRDGLRETMDKKSFWVLGVLSLLFVLLCWSISFTEISQEEALKESLETFRLVKHLKKGDASFRDFEGLEFAVSDLRESAQHPGTRLFGLTVQPAPLFHEAVATEVALRSGTIQRAKDTAPGRIPETGAYPEPPVEEQVRFLRKRFVEAGFTSVKIERKSSAIFEVACKPAAIQQVAGAHRMGILFGLKTFPLRGASVSQVVLGFQVTLAEGVAGFFGVLVALIFTAFFIPGMLEKGNVEILLSKPIHRSIMLVYKFLGGLLYVFVLAVVLIGGSWLALSVRSGYWNPAYLASIGVLTLYFAILYSVSALFGVLWRSWIGSVLMTILAWALFKAVTFGYLQVHDPSQLGQIPEGWVAAMDAVRFVLPKTSELSMLNQLLLVKSHLGETMDEAMMREAANMPSSITWGMAISTSIGFILAMLGLACWRFSRKDY